MLGGRKFPTGRLRPEGGVILGGPCPKRRAPQVRGKGCAHGAPEIPGLAERAPAITAASRGPGWPPICKPENLDPPRPQLGKFRVP